MPAGQAGGCIRGSITNLYPFIGMSSRVIERKKRIYEIEATVRGKGFFPPLPYSPRASFRLAR
jgi:hypothetical protein